MLYNANLNMNMPQYSFSAKLVFMITEFFENWQCVSEKGFW